MAPLSQKIDLIFSSFSKLSTIYRGPTPLPKGRPCFTQITSSQVGYNKKIDRKA
jgi:hypothetical protein